MKNITDGNKAKLKVKAKSLAKEARIIRKEERKMLHSHGKYHYANDCFNVNFVINEDEDDGHCVWHSELYLHRTVDVRKEARATHIARAFFKGKRYSDIESKVHCEFTQKQVIDRAARIVQKYGSTELRTKIAKSFIPPKSPGLGAPMDERAKYQKKFEQAERDAYRRWLWKWVNMKPLTDEDRHAQRMKLMLIGKAG